MKSINVLVSLYSLTAFIIIIERLSPTTQILIQPYNFIRLHELNQTILFLSITVILSLFILRSVTNDFQLLKGNTLLVILFVLGAYLFGSGEGWHEVASFTLNQYCNVNHIAGNLCGGLYINDYYMGNFLFFVGGVFMNFAILAFAAKQPVKGFTKKDMSVLLANSLVYAFTWFAYAAFDRVFVGLFFVTLLMVISLGFVAKIQRKFLQYPYITYSAVAYTLATLATVIVKFH